MPAWKEENPDKELSYVFVSWTGQHFPKKEDWRQLEKVGADAAKRMDTSAFWISTCCRHNLDEKIPSVKKAEGEQTIWAMSDIIRGARALAIALPKFSPTARNKTLREWGERLWTMPELLLMTGDHPILIYECEKGKQLTGPREGGVYRKELWNTV